MLSFPTGLAMDSRGNIYVANLTNAITVYAAGAEGNVAPSRTITGPKTRLNSPAGIAIDSQDELFVANQTNYDGHITIYASNANGDAAPIRTIRGKQDGIEFPVGRRPSIRSRTCTLPMKRLRLSHGLRSRREWKCDAAADHYRLRDEARGSPRGWLSTHQATSTS